jgi:hypothetical protein
MKPERIEEFLRRAPADEPIFVTPSAAGDRRVSRVKVSGRPAGAIGLAVAGIAVIAVLAAGSWLGGRPGSGGSPGLAGASQDAGYTEYCGGATVTPADIAATPQPLTIDEQAVIATAVRRAPTLLPATSWHRYDGTNGAETFVAAGTPNQVRRFVFINAGQAVDGTFELTSFGDCEPVGRGVGGLKKMSWTLEIDPLDPPTVTTTVLHGYVETSVVETVAGYTVTYGQVVTIAFWTRTLPVASGRIVTLEGVLHQVTVQLAEPLGGRDVYDGVLEHSVATSPPISLGY